MMGSFYNSLKFFYPTRKTKWLQLRLDILLTILVTNILIKLGSFNSIFKKFPKETQNRVEIKEYYF